jgi:hypothetical protein
VLYTRSRGLLALLVTLVCAAALTWWAGNQSGSYLDPYRRVPLVSLAPLLASAAVGVSLHHYSPELDRTAVRPWWPRRLAHLLVLTALAAGVLALSVPGHSQEFGAAAMVRNTLGAIGLTAAASVIIGARLSWLPTMLYFSALYMSFSSPRLRTATSVSWSMQSGPQPGAWTVALSLFAVGTLLYVVSGPRTTAE